MPNYQAVLETLQQPNPDLKRKPSDRIPGSQRQPDIGDVKYLQEWLLKSLRSAIAQRDTFGFNEKRLYDIKS